MMPRVPCLLHGRNLTYHNVIEHLNRYIHRYVCSVDDISTKQSNNFEVNYNITSLFTQICVNIQGGNYLEARIIWLSL